MPGPGKRTQKKKWHENTFNLDANIAAGNTVLTAPSTNAQNVRSATSKLSSPNDNIIATPPANEIAADTASYMALPATTTVTAADLAPNSTDDTSNATRVDIATAASPPVDSIPNTSSLTYSHEEVLLLLEDAKLEEYQEGYKKGSRKWMEGYKAGYDAKGKLDQEKEERA